MPEKDPTGSIPNFEGEYEAAKKYMNESPFELADFDSASQVIQTVSEHGHKKATTYLLATIRVLQQKMAEMKARGCSKCEKGAG